MAKINLGFKLKSKLVLVVLFPSLLCIIALFYFLNEGQTMTAHSVVVVSIGILLAVYAAAALIFSNSLTKEIKHIEAAAMDLSIGKITSNGQVSRMPELKQIVKAIGEAQNNIQTQSSFAEQIKAGNLSANYDLHNASDKLGAALLSIKENLIGIYQEDQQRKWASEGLARFVQVLQSAKNLKDLSNDIVVNLVRTISANQGAIFFLNDENGEEALEMQACYAFNRSKHLTQKISPGEGLIGQAFLEKGTVYLKDVPKEFTRITSGLGEANPRHVLIVPLKINETVVGIVELASFNAFSDHVIAFVEKIGESIAHTVSSFRVTETTKRMLDESKAQAEQMRAQEEELRQNQEELQATQEAISRKYDALFQKLGDLNRDSRFEQLKSITATKKRNIEYYFDIIRNQIISFSEDIMIVEAVKAFRSAFYGIKVDLDAEELKSVRSRVTAYYRNDFIPKLNDYVSMELEIGNYLPSDPRTLIFQDLYIASNPYPTGSKSALNEPGDGSTYSKVHGVYHSILRNFLEKFGYYDIFLIDASTGDMLYSVFKEVDFATNLLNGQYSKANFGKVVRNAIESTDRNFVQLIDFEPYDPSYHAPASFIATVVYDGDEKIGILVFQMPIQKINQILTGNNSWRSDGLGDSGETFIVGSDCKLRSVSRAIIEDLDGRLSLLKRRNYSSSVLQQIRRMQTNILMEEVKIEAVKNGLMDKTGTTMEDNGYGNKVLTAYAPLSIADVKWMIMSTMLEAEASSKIESLRRETA